MMGDKVPTKITGKIGQFTVEKFPEEYIQLMIEVTQYHPVLWSVIKNMNKVEEQLGEIGAYCKILLDGSYSFTDLCHDLYLRLKAARAVEIWTPQQ